jgi:hypothetical protein
MCSFWNTFFTSSTFLLRFGLGYREVWTPVPFFASSSAISLPPMPICEGTHWKAIDLFCFRRCFSSLRHSVIVSSSGVWLEVIAWIAAFESAHMAALVNIFRWKGRLLSPTSMAFTSPSKAELLVPTEMYWLNNFE